MNKNIDTKDIRCEFLIIGSGAGGSVASKYLTDLGKDVLLVEEGNRYSINEFKNSISKSFLYAWRNGGITPVLSKSNYGFGEGKCLGGGTYINGGLIWRTPEIVLQKWNKIYQTNIFEDSNLKKYFDEIENILAIKKQFINEYENNESLKLIEIGKKNNIKVVRVPDSINSSNDENKLTLGAAGDAKNSIIQKYIYPSEKKGLKILTNCRAEKIFSDKNKVKKVMVKINDKKTYIYADNVILACGATQTPMLLKKSFGNNFLKSELEVHLNLRIGVKFKEKMQDREGLMFTRQIQEYLESGVLIMPTSFNKNNFFSSLAKLDNNQINMIEKEIDKYSSFIIQLSSLNKVQLNNFFGNTILNYNLHNEDINKLKNYFKIFCGFLFDTGAEEIYLPFKKKFYVNKNHNLGEIIENCLTKENIEMVSVHGMSSARMGIKNSKKSKFNLYGRSFDFENLYCVDSSILPTSTIESPQATIMAVAKHVLENNFN